MTTAGLITRQLARRSLWGAGDPVQRRRVQASFPRLLTLITAIGCALRFVGLGAQSLWSDEAETVSHLHESVANLVATVTNNETTPHLYFLLVKLWTTIFGTSAVGARSLSALAGSATVPLTALIARELWSRRAGLVAAVLTATNPILVWYSQEARAYALFVLFATLALLYFTRVVKDLRARNIWFWGLWSALALLTHYFAIFWILAQAGYLCLIERRRKGDRHTALIVSGMLMLLAVPLGALANYQRTAPANQDSSLFSSASRSTRLENIPKDSFLGPPQPCLTRPGQGCAGPAGARSFALGALLLLLALASLARQPAERYRGALTCLVLTVGAAVGVPVALAVLGADFIETRNVICGVVPCLLLIAGGASINWKGLISALGFTTIGVVSVIAVLSNPALQRSDYRGLAQRAGKPLTTRAIVMNPGMSGEIFGVYWPDARLMLPGQTSTVDEIDVAALNSNFYGSPPPIRPIAVPSGFHLVQRVHESDYTFLRLRAASPRPITWTALVPLNLMGGSVGVYVQHLRTGGR